MRIGRKRRRKDEGFVTRRMRRGKDEGFVTRRMRRRKDEGFVRMSTRMRVGRRRSLLGIIGNPQDYKYIRKIPVRY